MHTKRWRFDLAKTASEKSKDRGHKVGAVVIGPDGEIRSLGYNGFVRGADDSNEIWHKRPNKYKFTIHAEANCVSNAARYGASLKRCEVYVTLPPCSQCTALLCQCGVKAIHFLLPIEDVEGWNQRWAEDFRFSIDIATAAKVELFGYSGHWDKDPESDRDRYVIEIEQWWKHLKKSEE